MLEDCARHAAQVFVELFHQLLGIGAFRHRGEPDDVGKQNRRRNSDPAQTAVIAVRIVEDLLHEIFGDVTFERAPGPQFLHPFQDVFEQEGEETAAEKGDLHRDDHE